MQLRLSKTDMPRLDWREMQLHRSDRRKYCTVFESKWTSVRSNQEMKILIRLRSKDVSSLHANIYIQISKLIQSCALTPRYERRNTTIGISHAYASLKRRLSSLVIPVSGLLCQRLEVCHRRQITQASVHSPLESLLTRRLDYVVVVAAECVVV